MNAPDDASLRGRACRDSADQVGMIHPCLDDRRPLTPQVPGQFYHTPRIGNPRFHAHHSDRDAGINERLRDGHIVDEGNDGWFKLLAVGAQE